MEMTEIIDTNLKTKPLVSVIVPCYNAEKYIGMLIDSILAQILTNFELLLINDGSKDTTPQILNQYAEKDHRIKVIHKENGGVSSARNAGLDHARGTYISFIDSDDYMYPDNLQTMVEEIEDYDLLICNYTRCEREKIEENNNQRKRKKTFEITGRGETMAQAIRKMKYKGGAVWNQLFLREIIEKLHLRFEQTVMEDELFSFQYLIHVTSLKQIDYEGLAYIYTPDSLSGNHKYIAEIDWIRKMEVIYDAIIEKYQLKGDELYTYHWRIANWMTILSMKGYYRESYKPYRKRLAVWKDIRKDEWFKKINPARMGIKIRTILYIAKFRLYYILEPAFLIYGRMESIESNK